MHTYIHTYIPVYIEREMCCSNKTRRNMCLNALFEYFIQVPVPVVW